MITTYPVPVEQAMQFTFAALNERQRRLYAATEALKLGHGGIVYLAELLGCHRRTIERGLNDLRQSESLLPPHRARKKGGRQGCLTLFPGIDEAFVAIVDPCTAGDPDQDGVLWTNLSRSEIAAELLRRGFRVSVVVVAQLLERHHDHKIPLLFLQKSKVSVLASFAVGDKTKFENKKLKVQGVGPDGMKFAATDAQLINKGGLDLIVMTKAVEGDKALPDTIKYYKSFKIEWELSVDDGQNWTKEGSSENRLYVILGIPNIEKIQVLYESVIDIAVRNADGKKVQKDIVEAIWADFENPIPGVKRKEIDGFNHKDGASMQYWVDAGAEEKKLKIIASECKTVTRIGPLFPVEVPRNR